MSTCACGCGSEVSGTWRRGHNPGPGFAQDAHPDTGTYRWRMIPGHPMADARGRVREHRIVMAAYLELAFLPRRWHVHHKNGTRSDNRIENLTLFKSNAAHRRHHTRRHV